MGARLPWAGLVGTLLALVLAWGAVERGLVGGTPVVSSWDPATVDWLFYVSLAAIGWFVIVPIVANPRRRARYRRAIAGDAVAVACVGYLVTFVVVGTVGVAVLPYVRPTIAGSLQPPVFAWTSLEVAGECTGRTVADRCLGTLTHPFGTDHVGRSVLPPVVNGAGVAVRVVTIVTAIAVPIAVVVGASAGYLGGRIDAVLMRYVDVQSTVPAFLVYLIVAFVHERSLLLFVVVFGLLSWGGVARIVRSEVLQLREEGYVAAARAAGVGPVGVFRRHLVPNLSGTILTAFTQTLAWILLVEAALAFLGLGAGDVDSWGAAIDNGFQLQVASVRESWWVTTMPMLALMTTVIAFAVIGDRLRDATDPRTVRG